MRKSRRDSIILDHLRHPSRLSDKKIGDIMGCSTETVRRVRLKAGIDPMESQTTINAQKLEAIYADPDFGMVSGRAAIFCRALAKRHEVSPATIIKYQKVHNIKAFGAVDTPHIQPSEASIHLNNWRRPAGIDKLLAEIKEARA